MASIYVRDEEDKPTTSAPLYHLNPETERIGVCRVQKTGIKNGHCPFSSEDPHFGSKEEAQAYYENKLEAEYGLFGDGGGELSLNKDAVAKRLNLLPEEALTGLVRDRWSRGGWTPKEVQQQMKRGEPFYVSYNGANQEMTLDIEDPATHRTFTKGACANLAAELHKATGWPIVVYSDGYPGYWRGHAVVKMPDGRYLDAGGPTKDPLKPYGNSIKDPSVDEVDGQGLAALVLEKPKKGETVNGDLPMLERFAVAKFAYDLLEGWDLLTD